MLTYHFIITGRVQGVGYRYTAYINAKKLDIVGSVANLLDGSVEVFAQGSDEKIDAFRRYLKLGSFISKVENIEENILDMKEFKKFSILN